MVKTNPHHKKYVAEYDRVKEILEKAGGYVMSLFFGKYGKHIGLNADIQKHRDEEKRILLLIEKYEAEGNECLAETYRRFLDLLRVSKTELVDQLGRKKNKH